MIQGLAAGLSSPASRAAPARPWRLASLAAVQVGALPQGSFASVDLSLDSQPGAGTTCAASPR